MAKIELFLRYILEKQDVSDLHLVTGSQPFLRVSGVLEKIQQHNSLSNKELKEIIYEIIPSDKINIFEDNGDIDFAYQLSDEIRFRVNVFKERQGICAVFRLINSKILSIDDLGLPLICKDFAMLKKGLVLITGPTGSGKSTTLAAIIDYANEKRTDHIITIEDPIEFIHQNKNCLINQREVTIHTRSFASALKATLREDPDIILVGEIRDIETIQLAIDAANTGHLVFGTLHTANAIKTIDRIVDVFPPHQQEQIRVSLSESLKGVISQALLKRLDMEKRCLATEVLIVNYAVSNLIRENKSHQILSIMQINKNINMHTLDDSLLNLFKKGWISITDAMEISNDKDKFKIYL